MSLREMLSDYWYAFQQELFPRLESELGPMGERYELFVAVLELVRVEALLPYFRGQVGRPEEDRAALARAFIAKAVNGGGIMYRRGGVKMYHGLRRELVRVVHGRDPRAGRRALRAAGGGPRVGEWNGRLPPLMPAVGRVEVDPHGPTASKCQGGRFGVFPGKPEGPR